MPWPIGAARHFVTLRGGPCYGARALISWILIALALLSVLLNLWQWYAGRCFPLRVAERTEVTPPVSILRPLKGFDAETERCLESWFQQDYTGKSELLFGVASESDPVCEIVRGLITKYPAQRAELVICQPILGPNAKVSSLCHLLKRAANEVIVMSDQDVFAFPNSLSMLIAPLEQKDVGLVNCFYVLANPRGFAMCLEALAVNADFWSQVLQGNTLKPMDFALGAAMATTKIRLKEIGGLEPLLDYLADDFQLGNRIARTGARLEISRFPVECRSEPLQPRTVWNHQLRWARTIRACRPAAYFFSILGNGSIWPLMGLVAGGKSGMLIFVTALVIRVVTAEANYRRFKRENCWNIALLAPAKDLFQLVIWALAFVGNEITWRDHRFHVDQGGKLTPLA